MTLYYAYYFPGTSSFLAGSSLFLVFLNCSDVFLTELSIYRIMSQFQGKELIRRLAWLVFQDQEHYRHQLENAVSNSSTFPGKVLEYGIYCQFSYTFSRTYSRSNFFQGFSSQEFTSTEAACIILACELRTGKNFTLEDIQSGKLKDHLSPEDYDLEQRVCISHYLHCTHSFSCLYCLIC